MDIFEIMKYAIIAGGAYATMTQFWQSYREYRRKFASAWVHLVLGILSLYWTAYYLRSALDFEPFQLHQAYVRAPLLATIVFIGIAGAYGVRRIK